jgi:putative transposase
MSRLHRLHVPGGHYHVTLRGNHREPLFETVGDRRKLDTIVADVIEQFGARIHAYCWMTNHLHVLIQIAERPLGKIMQRIAIRYARYRHLALGTSGHLFERRYNAKLVDVDAYFLAVLRYIHLNPVQAHIVNDPAEYPWSSHRAFLGMESVPWLTTEFGLSLLGPDIARARLAYRAFMVDMAEDIDKLDERSHPEDSRVLGTDAFLYTLPMAPHDAPRPLDLEQLAQRVCSQHQCTVAQLRSPSRARYLTSVRLELLRQALGQRVANLTQVAKYLGRDSSALNRLLARHTTKRSAGAGPRR